MTVRAEIGGVRLEVWFTPSFNIKTERKDLEQLLRSMEFEVFDIWELRTRRIKATKGERECFLVLDYLRDLFPDMKIKITEHPLPEGLPEEQESPATH